MKLYRKQLTLRDQIIPFTIEIVSLTKVKRPTYWNPMKYNGL